jgi:hypothetical protein
VKFLVGQWKKQIAVVVLPNAASDGDRRVRLRLSNATGARLVTSEVDGVILDDDPVPQTLVSVGDAGVYEGEGGNRVLKFPVTLSSPAAGNVTVLVSTVAPVAGPGAQGGTKPLPGVDFKVRTNSKYVAVTVYPDAIAEGDELLQLVLGSVTGPAAPGRTAGTGAIYDDDG